MSDVWLGVIALVAGLVFCFRGQLALRAIIAIWGGFVGFFLGATLAAAAVGGDLLAGPVGWIAALVGAFVFAGLAYAFYSLAVAIAMGSIGFGLGTVAATALGASDGVVTAVGVGGAILLARFALATGLQHLLLVVASALGGAAAIVAGVMLLIGAADVADFAGTSTPEVLATGWWWNAAYFAIALAGVIVQTRARRPVDTRRAWEGEVSRPR